MERIYSTNKVVDSRDVIKRLRDLEDEREDLVDEIAEANQDLVDHDVARDPNAPDDPDDAQARKAISDRLEQYQTDLTDWDGLNGEELAGLRKLNEEGEALTGEWTHGVSLINRTYWIEYVQELLTDIGDLPAKIPHYIAIDWDKTADNIEANYSELEWDGETFLVRDC
jgi:hypothetical protein